MPNNNKQKIDNVVKFENSFDFIRFLEKRSEMTHSLYIENNHLFHIFFPVFDIFNSKNGARATAPPALFAVIIRGARHIIVAL